MHLHLPAEEEDGDAAVGAKTCMFCSVIAGTIVDPENWTTIMPLTWVGIRRVKNGGEEESYERV